MILFGFFYSSLAVALALFIFPREAGPVMLVLSLAAFMPLMLNLMQTESLKDSQSRFLVKEHWPALKLFVFLFIGMLVSYTIWFLLLPAETTANLFGMQIETITGRGVEIGALVGAESFFAILLNNIKVLLVGIVLAFVFGAGAVFILEWNATVLATLLGGTIKNGIGIGFAKFLVHGIPEISAYFVGGLAGGIISLGIARHQIGTKDFKKTIVDSAELILLSILILVIAGLLEVYISPRIG